MTFFWGGGFAVHGVYQLSGEIVGSRRDTTYVNVLKRHGYATALVSIHGLNS